MSWRPDQQTQEKIDDMVKALFAVAPDVLGIDEFLAGCEIASMDLYGVGVGVYPRFIQCDIRGYMQPVFYRGGLATLAVGDSVTVVHIRDGDLYEVAGPGGATGAAGLTGTGANTQVTYWTGPNTIAGDAGMTYNAATNALTMMGNVILDDGAGDSPMAQFVGGSNDDTAQIFLEDDAVAFNSDLVVRLPGPDADARVIFRSTTPADVAWIDGLGGSFFAAGMEVNAATLDESVLVLETTDDDVTNALIDFQETTPDRAYLASIDGDRFIHRPVKAYGHHSLFIGTNAGNFTSTTSNHNVGIGEETLQSLTTGQNNVAIGWTAGTAITTGNQNVLVGSAAGVAINTGQDNFCLGFFSGTTLTSGSWNVFIGSSAGQSATTAGNNIGLGQASIRLLTTGNGNVAIGSNSLATITTTGENVAIGNWAMKNGVGATKCTSIGYFAGLNISTGIGNISVGWSANDLGTTGDYNIIIGYNVDPSGAAVSNELNIGDLIYGDMNLNTAGVNVTPPNLLATWHVDQLSTTAAIPVLYLDQADISEEMIEFNTTIGVGNAIEAVGAKTLTVTHFVKVTIPGPLARYIPVGTIA